jgi:hypothetical protein
MRSGREKYTRSGVLLLTREHHFRRLLLSVCWHRKRLELAKVLLHNNLQL